MDIYSNPKQKQKDHVPEEFLCESSSSSDESSDKEELQPPQTEDEAPPLTLEQSDNKKKKNGKRKKNSPESTSALYNKQPRQERLATPRPPNTKPSTSSGLLRTPPNPSSQEQVDLQSHLSFNGPPPTHHPKNNAGHF